MLRAEQRLQMSIEIDRQKMMKKKSWRKSQFEEISVAVHENVVQYQETELDGEGIEDDEVWVSVYSFGQELLYIWS